ncbi:MAG TPA: hypothetical protein VJ932_05270 [Alkalispirochaeta sp.]|nr:hypothetical protein [Alkalispirochaeta sp.]
MTNEMIVIDTAGSFLGLSREDAVRALGETVQQISGDEYGNMKNVISMEACEVFPGTLYLRNDAVALIRLGTEALATVTMDMLRARFGTTAVRRASRAGKQANLWVYAEQGIAFSARGQTIHFLEVFSPCSQEEYEAQIYKNPGDFIR